MIWAEIEADFLKSLPQLQTGKMTSGDSSCQWFYLPFGFRGKEKVFSFGFLDWKNESEAQNIVSLLLTKAQELGALEIFGPLNLSTYLDYRVKLDFFSDQTYPGEPQNATWLPQLLEANGFYIDKKYYSNEFKIAQARLLGLFLIYGSIAKWKLRKSGYRFVFLNKENVHLYLKEMHEIVHEIFHRNYLYLDIPHPVFLKYVTEKYLTDLNSDISAVVLDKEGHCVGFTLGLSDRAYPDRILFKTIGIKVEHSRHGRLSLWLMSETFKRALFKYKNCLACLAIENKAIQKKFSQVSHKTMSYALYSRKL